MSTLRMRRARNTPRLLTAAPRQVPAELLHSVPREVTLTPAGKAVAALIVGLLLAAMVDPWIYVAAKRDVARFNALERQSVVSDGEVVSIGRAHGKESRRTVTYRYSFEDRTYTGTAELRRGESRGLRAGARIAVRYVPSQPATNWLPGHEPRGVPLWVVPLVPTCALSAGLLLAYALRKQRAFLATGRAALARVTRHERAHKGEHGVDRVWYEFKVLSGAMRTGHYDVQRTPPEVGSTLIVLYDPDAPEKNVRYPLALVRTTRPPSDLGNRKYF